jgi:hypothetical protein
MLVGLFPEYRFCNSSFYSTELIFYHEMDTHLCDHPRLCCCAHHVRFGVSINVNPTEFGSTDAVFSRIVLK